MAKEKNLTAVTSVAAADFARVVTSAGASVKATFANVAKYIVETYNGSTVAGSAQSVKSALDSLNSKTSQYTDTTADSVSALILGKFNYVKSGGAGIYLLSGGWATHDFGFSLVWVQSSTRGVVLFFSSSLIYHGYINNGAVSVLRQVTETNI